MPEDLEPKEGTFDYLDLEKPPACCRRGGKAPSEPDRGPSGDAIDNYRPLHLPGRTWKAKFYPKRLVIMMVGDTGWLNTYAAVAPKHRRLATRCYKDTGPGSPVQR